ncbi:MAG: SRPBCC domain-containing protein [Chloroflexota bacterium]
MIDDLAQSTDDVLNLSYTFDASIDRVFAAWTKPELLKQWWGPEGSSLVLIEVDLQIGGKYRIGIRQPTDEVYFVGGQYQVLDPPHQLAFTWRWEEPKMDFGNSLVHLMFQSLGKQTKLTLTHERLPTPELRSHHRGGWVSMMGKLGNYIQTLT